MVGVKSDLYIVLVFINVNSAIICRKTGDRWMFSSNFMFKYPELVVFIWNVLKEITPVSFFFIEYRIFNIFANSIAKLFDIGFKCKITRCYD